jgi:FixJ family two-component response regulator
MSANRQPTPVSSDSTRVAIVDDDPGVRRALARLLLAVGYDVRTFGSAEEFLESGRPLVVDCLIVDVYLGGMSGFDLHAELSAGGHALPTVFVTAHDDTEVAAGLLRSAGVACLSKPFEDDTLLAAIAGALRGVGS